MVAVPVNALVFPVVCVHIQELLVQLLPHQDNETLLSAEYLIILLLPKNSVYDVQLIKCVV